MKVNWCLFFALLLVSYTLAAETSQQETNTQKARDGYKVEAGGNYGGGGGGGGRGGGGGGWGCRYGCCYRGYGRRCARCCSSPEEANAFAEKQAHP